MRKKQRWMIVALAIAMTMVARSAIAADEAEGFKTSRPAMLERLVPEVKIEPIISTGDVVGGNLGGFQFSGIPDGLGAYESSESTIDVLVNHELGGSAPSGVGSRVSQLQINEDRRVLSARYVIDGTEGFLRFCSSTLAGIDGVPWYFTGEEATNSAGPPAGGRGGSSIALNALTGR